MRSKKRIIITVLVCVGIAALAYFACMIPFYISVNSGRSAGGMSWTTPAGPWRFIGRCMPVKRISSIISGSAASTARRTPKQKPAVFMIIRWIIMIAFAFMMIWGGLIFGLGMSSLSIPVLSCPWNTEQMTESSCYYLSHLNELFELPIGSILLFFISTLGFIFVLGRVICGFLCPVGLIQDIMDKIRKKTKTEGIKMNEKMYGALTPVKWFILLIFIGLCFAGGNFCNFCPAVAVSSILAGISTSLYVSGFLMVLVLMGSFFKRRAFCTVCPLGTIMGFFHKLSLFRVKKDCQSCTECGACYEACPMGIKMIYTEREKADVTHANCIMCGECVRCCPEDNALSLTFAGKKIYTSSRKKIMSGYEEVRNYYDDKKD